MAAASYYHGAASPRPDSTVEMYTLQSPDPSYNRPNESLNLSHTRPHTSQQEYLNPAGYAPSGPVPQAPKPGNPLTRQERSKLQALKRYLRIVQDAAQVCSALFTIIIFGIMVYVNVKFYTTQDTVREGRTAWPKDGTKQWPSIMLFAASGITFIMSLVLLFGYWCCWKRTSTSWKFTAFRYVVQIMAWICVSVIYRYEKSLHGKDNDLWGWSCSTKAKAIQETFEGVVDFPTLCTAQVCPILDDVWPHAKFEKSGSWFLSIAEFVVKIVFAVGHYYIYRKKEPLEKRDFADGIGDATTGLLPFILNHSNNA